MASQVNAASNKRAAMQATSGCSRRGIGAVSEDEAVIVL